MKILLIVPEPFYTERGTPIAVKLLANTLSEFGHEIDLLTYHVGKEVSINKLKLLRIAKPPFCNKIPIGFSWRKVTADIYLSFNLLRLVIKNKYDVIHAVEESIFPAVFLNIFLRRKVIYDMDSSMSDQLIEKWSYLSRFKNILNYFEFLAAKNSTAVVAVCKYLAEKINKYNSSIKTFVLEDVAFEGTSDHPVEDLRQYCDSKSILMLYVGNLEHYQGIDLLLEALPKLNVSIDYKLILIGGSQEKVDEYYSKSKQLQIDKLVHFLGARPIANLNQYLKQADILVSPRLKGVNTPMKIYSYLASGVPVIATNITSHTQILNNEQAQLVDTNPIAFAEGLTRLLGNEKLRIDLGRKGKELAEENFSLKSYKIKLKNIYSWIESIKN